MAFGLNVFVDCSDLRLCLLAVYVFGGWLGVV